MAAAAAALVGRLAGSHHQHAAAAAAGAISGTMGEAGLAARMAAAAGGPVSWEVLAALATLASLLIAWWALNRWAGRWISRLWAGSGHQVAKPTSSTSSLPPDAAQPMPPNTFSPHTFFHLHLEPTKHQPKPTKHQPKRTKPPGATRTTWTRSRAPGRPRCPWSATCSASCGRTSTA
jgi:hypothetical protein